MTELGCSGRESGREGESGRESGPDEPAQPRIASGSAERSAQPRIASGSAER